MKLIKLEKAFTLAEVLITLGIIGVVAAMTIPTLINSYQKQATVVQLKDMYSILSSAEKASEAENGQSSSWDYTLSGYDFMTTYYEPYLKIIAKGVDEWNAFKVHITYKNMNGDSFSSGVGNFDYFASLTNGAILSAMKNGQFLIIRTDLNGLKPPNTLGIDVFDFEAMWIAPKRLTTGAIEVSQANRNAMISDCKAHVYTGGSPSRCAAVIQYDGWKISDDYPWN